MGDEFIPTEVILSGGATGKYPLLLKYPSLRRYSAWKHLGGGAFGTVFAGVHAHHGRIEAVKRIAIPDPRARAMAVAEVRVMAQLPPHPHLVTLYDADETDDALFLTMQYVDGKPLDDTPLPVPIKDALRYTRDTADALSMVHSYGVVHRDIKPGNLFTTRTGAGILGDFGVARAVDSHDRTAAIAGSPAYMAPEAFTGQATPLSDLWSLGVMLYELLTGKRPFQHLEALPFEQFAPAVTAARFDFPSVVRRGVPARIDELVLRLLAPRPADRLQSALAVLDYLPRYGTEVSAVEADLTLLDVEALVVSANERLAMNVPHSSAAAVLHAGGQRVLDEAQQHAPAPVGSAVVTSGGELRAKHVFHAITQHVNASGYLVPAKEGELRKALWSALRKAHELRVKSLGLPALGTYSGGLTVDDAARMMVDVVHMYLLEFRPPLERVVFALSDKPIAIAFREAALARGMLLV